MLYKTDLDDGCSNHIATVIISTIAVVRSNILSVYYTLVLLLVNKATRVLNGSFMIMIVVAKIQTGVSRTSSSNLSRFRKIGEN